MCPYTLDHNKMLASTMQHSTHNHTPTHHQPPHHNPPQHHATGRSHALGPPRQEWHQATPQPGVSSGPNSVPSPAPQQPGPSEQAAQCSTQPHPHTTTTQ